MESFNKGGLIPGGVVYSEGCLESITFTIKEALVGLRWSYKGFVTVIRN